jgi:hypothetical protein
VGLRTWFSSYRFKNLKVTAPDGTILLEGLPELAPAAPNKEEIVAPPKKLGAAPRATDGVSPERVAFGHEAAMFAARGFALAARNL